LHNLGYKDKTSVQKLIGNLANFKCKEGIYKLEYNEEFYSPQTWWKFVDNNTNILRKVALKLFAIVPHSASCERIFSGLGWFYSNRRQNLSVTTVESMSKIRHFCFKNTSSELQYSGKTHTEEELVQMLNNSNLFEDDKLDLLEEEDGLDLEIIDEQEIPQHEVFVLIMTNDIDLTNPIFNTNEEESEDENSDNSNNREIEEPEEEEFDIDDILKNVSFNRNSN